MEQVNKIFFIQSSPLREITALNFQQCIIIVYANFLFIQKVFNFLILQVENFVFYNSVIEVFNVSAEDVEKNSLLFLHTAGRILIFKLFYVSMMCLKRFNTKMLVFLDSLNALCACLCSCHSCHIRHTMLDSSFSDIAVVM